MKVTINIEKRYAYLIIGLLVLTAGFFIVNALTPGVTPNPGHLIDDVAPPSGCSDGQVLQFIDNTNGWGCVDVTSIDVTDAYPNPLSVPTSAFICISGCEGGVDSRSIPIPGTGSLFQFNLFNEQIYVAPVYLPQGAEVTKLTLYGTRLDNDAIMTLYLLRNRRDGGGGTMAVVDCDWISVQSKSDDTIRYPIIDNLNYAYALSVVLDPDGNDIDVQLTGAVIEWN